MSYNISKSDGTPITVPDNTEITTYSVPLLGRNVTPYGSDAAQATVRQLENFSNTVPPRGAIKGQLWFDSQTDILKVWTGADPASSADSVSADRTNADWVPVGGVVTQDLIPDTDNAINVGSADRRYKNLYAVTMNGTQLNLRNCVSVGTPIAIAAVGNISLQGDITPETSSTISNSCQYITSSNLGTFSKNWDSIHVKNANIYTSLNLTNVTNDVTAQISFTISNSYELVPVTQFILGTVNNRVTNIYTNGISTNTLTVQSGTSQGVGSALVPIFDNTYDLGTSARRYRNVYAVTVTGNATTSTLAASATKLASARTISLTGGVTGSASFDGSADVSIAATVQGLGTAANYNVSLAGSNANLTNLVPIVKSDGVMEVGRYIDFHHTNTSGTDYDVRLSTDGSTANLQINGATIWNTANLPTVYTQAQVNSAIASAIAAAKQALYPVGSLYVNYSNGTNPATLLGFGTWSAYSQGRVLTGVGFTTDAAGNYGGWGAAGQVGGEFYHTLSWNEMPQHNHGYRDRYLTENNAAAPPSRSPYQEALNGYNGSFGTGDSDYDNNVFMYIDSATATAGANAPHPNIQPFVTVYMWVRVA